MTRPISVSDQWNKGILILTFFPKRLPEKQIFSLGV